MLSTIHNDAEITAEDHLSYILGKVVNTSEEKMIHTTLAATSPFCKHKVRDGNCLFRTISKFVLGTDKGHMDIQHIIVAFMQLPINIVQFERHWHWLAL